MHTIVADIETPAETIPIKTKVLEKAERERQVKIEQNDNGICTALRN